jgi:transposase InsO family protein
MDERRRLVSLVLENGWSVAAAAREIKVSRQAAYLWLKRAKESGIAGIQELSRTPKSFPSAASEEIVKQVLALGEIHPYWGSRKLHALLWPGGEAPVCERTVARILARAGRRGQPPHKAKAAPIRFERENANDLWQTDLKKVGHRRHRSDALSVLDDATRFSVALEEVPDQTLESIKLVLWEAFGEYGLPLQMLSDNGSAFRNNATWRWSKFDLWLMLLGIKSIHGKPYHPQTQGKVERFHGTIEKEVRFEKGCNVQAELDPFRVRYNWVRPHESLERRTPGSVYKPSTRKRPDTMPEPFFPGGSVLRRAGDGGIISYKGEKYKLGRAFEGLPVGIKEADPGILKLYWGEFALAPLEDLRV